VSCLRQKGTAGRLSEGLLTGFATTCVWRTFDGEKAMFNNLDEQIEGVQGRGPNKAERLVRYLVVAVVSVLVFGGLLLGVWFLEF
jgi:hypothetical protein